MSEEMPVILEKPKESVPVRQPLPDERKALTHKFSIAGHEGYITVGMYDDGRLGEIFLVMAREGSTISGLMDAFAMTFSLALQYGVPLEALVERFEHVRFEPSGFTKNQDIPYAKSVLDYVVRWLRAKFIPKPEAPAEKATCHYCSTAFQVTDGKGECPKCHALYGLA